MCLFSAVLALGCWGLFSSCSGPGLLSGCPVWASRCGGLSCCGALALQGETSVAASHGLSRCGSRTLSTGSVVVVQGLSRPEACGIFQD